jgi:orotate phosphoribosyltransferase
VGLENVDYISGTATAAIPQASWVAWELHLPMVYVRPTTKSYGKGNKLEGHLKKGSKVLIIEDHISTASSVENNAKTIIENGGKVKYCIATTTYETKQATETLKKNGIILFTLTTGKVIVEEAAKKERIKREEMEKILLWLEDPQNWAKRMGFE